MVGATQTIGNERILTSLSRDRARGEAVAENRPRTHVLQWGRGTCVAGWGVSGAALVGRVREQSALGQCIDAALNGRARLVLIGGEAGIGKTALVGVVTDQAQARGAQVLAGHCYDL